MQWGIHDIFHIDLLTPYHETNIHGPNYSRPPPDLIDNEEEYKVKKILDSQRFGRRCKLQYLIKWKGYPDSDNEWVNKNDVHASQAIREFKNQNPTSETHINAGSTGKFLTPLPSFDNATILTPLMSHVINTYYLGSPTRIFGPELSEGLITLGEAWELCAKKYIRPTVTDKNKLTTSLTKVELA